MNKPVPPIQPIQLEDGEVVIYPLKPFGQGYVLDEYASARLKKESVYWALIGVLFCFLAPYLIPVIFAVYVARVRRHAYRRVPAIPLRASAKLQAQQTSRLLSGIIVIGCSVAAGALETSLGEAPELSEAFPLLALIMIVSLIGMYGMWMFRIRARVRRGWW